MAITVSKINTYTMKIYLKKHMLLKKMYILWHAVDIWKSLLKKKIKISAKSENKQGQIHCLNLAVLNSAGNTLHIWYQKYKFRNN